VYRGTLVSLVLNGSSVILGDKVSIEVEVLSVLELLNTEIVSTNSFELLEGLLSIAATLSV
jgi:hypothetical protein